MAKQKITLSVIKADVGGYVGHSAIHPALLEKAEQSLKKAKKDGLIIDYYVGHVGDDTALIMTHKYGIESEKIHQFAWTTFEKMTEVAAKYGQYGVGQDLLTDTFSGNLKGMGPGYGEMEFKVRPSEPLIIFLADKTEPGAWNLPLFRIFADPFNTIGLVIDPKAHSGFKFEVLDLIKEKTIVFSCPAEMYDMLVFIGAPSKFVIKNVYTKEDEIAAATSTQRLALMAGRYVGKDDPVMIVRSQSGLPAVGEVLEPFAFPHTVAGWMRGSHHGPLMPVGVEDATPTRFDGPPRVVALGFQLTGDAKFIGPRDMFADKSYDKARQIALEVADYLRRHGPFEPHRLPLDEMEYTTMPQVMDKLKNRFKKAD